MADYGYCGSSSQDEWERMIQTYINVEVTRAERRRGKSLSEAEISEIEERQRYRFKLQRQQLEEDRAVTAHRQQLRQGKPPTELSGVQCIHDWVKPEFRRPEYWTAVKKGRITWDDVERDQAEYGLRRDRARMSHGRKAPPPPRRSRSAPERTRQYAMAMSTMPAHDQRITPNAKVLLQILRAEMGSKESIDYVTRSYLAQKMQRSTKTIGRYLDDLCQAGYLVREKVTDTWGMITGLALTLTEIVKPIYARGKTRKSRRNLAGTKMSSNKGNYKNYPKDNNRENELSTGLNDFHPAFVSG